MFFLQTLGFLKQKHNYCEKIYSLINIIRTLGPSPRASSSSECSSTLASTLKNTDIYNGI